jgi:hypothetical protein
MKIQGFVTQYGFDWGAATVERWASDEKKGWIVIGLRTPRHKDGLQIHVTRTGKVRIFGNHSEWKPIHG